jgi:hypothetical protein
VNTTPAINTKLSLRLKPALRLKIEREAADTQKSMASVVEQALKFYFNYNQAQHNVNRPLGVRKICKRDARVVD